MDREVLNIQDRRGPNVEDFEEVDDAYVEDGAPNERFSIRGVEDNIRTIDDVIDFTVNNFGFIDNDDNGKLTESELENVRKSKVISDENKSLVQSMLGKVSLIGDLDSRDSDAESKGISKSDLIELRRMASRKGKNSRASSDLIASIEANLPGRNLKRMECFGQALLDWFPRIDQDSNKAIGKMELESFINDQKNHSEGKEVSRVLLENFDDFKEIVSSKRGDIFIRNYGINKLFNEDSSTSEISDRDIFMFSNYLSRPYQFKLELASVRKAEIRSGVRSWVRYGASARVADLMSNMSTNPVVKGVFDAASTGYNAASLYSLELTLKGNTDRFQTLYNQRQEMINSWKYFE